MENYTLLEKKAALVFYVLVCAFEKITAVTETYEKFARHNMDSTLTICFLHHWQLFLIKFIVHTELTINSHASLIIVH